MAIDSICINIWDDYYSDGFIPEGKIQETYGYVESTMHEDSNLDDESCKQVLELLKERIKGLSKPEWSLELYLNYHDSAKIYPNLVGTEHEFCLYKRWQLEMKHIPHVALEYLVDSLKTQQLKYQDRPITVYSES